MYGFDMSKASDRLCVNYLRQMQTLSTEKSSIDHVFHPLFVQHVCKILKVSTVSDKDMQRILYLEKAYLKKYTAFKSGRENVLTELRPRVEEFTNDLIAEKFCARPAAPIILINSLLLGFCKRLRHHFTIGCKFIIPPTVPTEIGISIQ